MQSGEKSEDLFLLPFRHTSLKVASMSSKKSVSIVWVPGAVSDDAACHPGSG